MKEPTEKQIQIGLCTRVKILQDYNQLSKEIYLIHIPNQHVGGSGYRVEKKTGRLIKNSLGWNVDQNKMGTRKGACDLFGLIKGGKVPMVAMETKKNSKCKLTPAQIDFKALCKHLGIPHLVYWDIEAGIEFLKWASTPNQ